MSVFTSTDAKVLMPRTILDGMVKDVRTTSTVARLSAREPMLFGESDIIVFNDFPKMEFVDEGADKGSTSGGFTSVTAKPHKGQVTLRFNEEVQWADEDYQLGILRELGAAGQVAISRGLDLGLFHRINPLTGTTIGTWTNYVDATQFRHSVGTTEADAAIRATVGLLVTKSKAVNGMAIDPKLAWDLANLQTKLANGDPSGTPRYPSLGFGTDVTDFLGIPSAQGDTVSGTPEAADTKVRAIVGDFANGIRWGIQRSLPVEIIRYGNPDGQGDLKRANQIALRLEVVWGWYAFLDRFAILDGKTTSSVALTPATATVAGGPVQMVATATYSDSSTAVVTASATEWTSATPAKATISDTGVLTPVAAGTSSITCKFDGKTATQVVTVS